ncbi:hypothetical protein C9I98_19235 [Photobacterium sanctipauli]|uniref:Uncharacterized protein n=1 Tax=Photobacterium sanctipauli TaxID=1342794 RepID=A0A2T3NNT7_9GAMM|nr:hypothetical protein [Photobacterium sanctipauli]PSW17651.1 hypothetical protein C9I98_19235 [Photobacterium sanctipauli]
MYTIFSILKWVVLIYLVKTGRIPESTYIKFKQFTLNAIAMLVLHAALVIHATESVELVSNGTGDGYFLRQDDAITNHMS